MENAKSKRWRKKEGKFHIHWSAPNTFFILFWCGMEMFMGVCVWDHNTNVANAGYDIFIQRQSLRMSIEAIG